MSNLFFSKPLDQADEETVLTKISDLTTVDRPHPTPTRPRLRENLPREGGVGPERDALSLGLLACNLR